MAILSLRSSIETSFANNITTSGVLLPASLNNNSIANVTAYNAAIATGNMVLISSQTASNSASISFTTGIDSTYKEYQFYFIDIHPRTDDVEFTFNLSTDSGSNYNVTKTSTFFRTYHDEADTATTLVYFTGGDLAQSTAFQVIANGIGNGADELVVGSLQLFNPSSTTYVKHFISNCNTYTQDNYTENDYIAGYGNTTSAINAIQFKMDSGNMDGTILMYGIV
jgi:hypothetical protein